MIIYFDGGCKPNPGEMEVGILSDDDTIRYHEYIGQGTNNIAEWAGLLSAMLLAYDAGHQHLHIRGDSTLVINQAKGAWRVKAEELKPFKIKYDEMRKLFATVKLEYVPRARNLAGIYIEQVNKKASK